MKSLNFMGFDFAGMNKINQEDDTKMHPSLKFHMLLKIILA